MSKKKKRNHQQYVLLIRHSLFATYEPIAVFRTSHDAHKYFDETYKGFPHRIISLAQYQREQKRKEDTKQRRKSNVKRYLHGVGLNIREQQQRWSF